MPELSRFRESEGGRATIGNDYQPASGQLTFTPGETSKPLTLAVNSDTTQESNETFFVSLSNPSKATIGKAQGDGHDTG